MLLQAISICAQPYRCDQTWYQGEGTQYGGVAGGTGGHCGIPVEIGDIYHAAMNHIQYDSSRACGSCVRILGPKGSVILKIVDECPECRYGDIDMTTGVFPQLADLKDGRIKIKWQFIPCPSDPKISIVFAPGSGPYYFKAQIRNFRYPIAKLEYKLPNSSFKEIKRTDYNYFVQENGIDADKSKVGPYDFKLTAQTGQYLDLNNIPFNTDSAVTTGLQFEELSCPDCAGIAGGKAMIDNCGTCSGGTTGIAANSTCTKDCNDYWDGTAYLDGCGKCVAGNTGGSPCDSDCNGQLGGMAYVDNCGHCVGGNTGLAPCTKDCHNDWGGSAFLDSCKSCAAGNTGQVAITDKSQCLLSNLENIIISDRDQFGLYPNPFLIEQEISNKYAGAFVSVFDLQGRLIYKQESLNLDTYRAASTLWQPGYRLVHIFLNNHNLYFKSLKR